jgi:hypothetical protein
MSDKKAMQWMREVCLALPNATESEHYGEIVFKAGNALFASCGDKRGPCRVIVQLEPTHAAALLAKDKRFKKYAYVPNGVSIAAGDVDDWGAIRALVEESYRLNVASPAVSPMKAKKRAAVKRKKGSTV